MSAIVQITEFTQSQQPNEDDTPQRRKSCRPAKNELSKARSAGVREHSTTQHLESTRQHSDTDQLIRLLLVRTQQRPLTTANTCHLLAGSHGHSLASGGQAVIDRREARSSTNSRRVERDDGKPSTN